ncbi:MAG: DUF177 domain-containing protein [Candidatus Omnitrophica bacterium]|nr:DUF177 domain-containing protein [Candidatus Omnitrophota bacterium]
MDLETQVISFRGPLKAEAAVEKITNAVSVMVHVVATAQSTCSRCLEEFEIAIDKNIALNYSSAREAPVIDINPDIREEIILDYPMKPLCRPDCKGLCSHCGKNLNKGGCNCATT